MRYDTKNFSIPTDSCFEEKHDWGVLRPTVIVLVKEGNSFLYLNQEKQADFPQTELAQGETITQATERVLNRYGYNSSVGRDNLAGYFSVGKRRIPHFLVIHFTKKNSYTKRGVARIDPITEVVNHRVFETLSQSLFSLIAEMEPSDCLGWGEDGLIIWPREERAVTSQHTPRRAVVEHMAA